VSQRQRKEKNRMLHQTSASLRLGALRRSALRNGQTNRDPNMDLLDFEDGALYFDEPLSVELERLLLAASTAFGTPAAELHLLRAFLLAPENLSVLVALFRHYSFEQQLEEAANVAERAMLASGATLGFPADWRKLDQRYLGRAVARSMGMVRFYLLALKARGCIGLRLRQMETARAMLAKVRELDGADRLGVAALLDIVDNRAGRRP
jgi:hypothetical protein